MIFEKISFMLSPGLFQLFVLLLLLLIVAISVKKRKLTLKAAFTAVIIGLLVFQAAGLKGILLLMTFFLLSVIATSHKKEVKAKINGDNLIGKPRNTRQVLANGGTAAITAILILIDPMRIELYSIMMAASLASALADTLSSELGMVYGRRFYNILTLKKEANGLDGVVSIEGLIIGLLGSSIIAMIYSGFGKTAMIVLVAGVVGNLADSLLGAALERKHYIENDLVNFLNTSIAALIAALLFYI